MDDDTFLSAALDQLSPETRSAASACAAVQLGLDRRLTPGEVMTIADALGAPRGPVLALLGWISARADRPNRRVFLDLFRPLGEPRWPDDRETLFALAICRSVH